MGFPAISAPFAHAVPELETHGALQGRTPVPSSREASGACAPLHPPAPSHSESSTRPAPEQKMYPQTPPPPRHKHRETHVNGDNCAPRLLQHPPPPPTPRAAKEPLAPAQTRGCGTEPRPAGCRPRIRQQPPRTLRSGQSRGPFNWGAPGAFHVDLMCTVRHRLPSDPSRAHWNGRTPPESRDAFSQR